MKKVSVTIQLAGNDYYNEVIVGRFCCETVDQVTNHVNKVLNYERDMDETATWLSVGEGVSKNEGAGGGHYGEADYVHQRPHAHQRQRCSHRYPERQGYHRQPQRC